MKPPIFIIGAQRSGTTMFRLMLNNHRNLALPHEVGFIIDVYKRLRAYGDLSKKENLRALLDDVCSHPLTARSALIEDKQSILDQPIDSYRSFVDAVMQKYTARFGKKRWGDRTHSIDVDILRDVYPECKMIHVVRDGRDVLVSQKRVSWLSNNLPALARGWQLRVTVYHKLHAIAPDQFHEVRYEDLVSQPEATLRRVCEFLDEPYDPGMLEYAESTASAASIPEKSKRWHGKSIQAPDPSKIGAWRTLLSLSDRVIFDQIAGPTLAELGYQREMLTPSLSSKLRKLHYDLIERW